MLATKLHTYLESILMVVTVPKKKPPGLVEAAEDAKKAWKQALRDLNLVDKSFIDYAVHNINAAERRYIALLRQARKERLTAWPDYSALAEPANEETEELIQKQTSPLAATSKIIG